VQGRIAKAAFAATDEFPTHVSLPNPCSACLVFVSTVCAQNAGAPVEVPPSLVPAELVPDTRALSAEEELKSFQVAPGYRVELAASEPLVGDPIFAQFGPDGRLWVVEMRGYMPDIHGNREDEPVGRIVILTDTDGDGRFDQSKVFLDQLIMPRTVLPIGDGALVGAPPMLWYCPDKNGDGKADEKIVVAQDAGAQTIPGRPELANPEHGANSPLWGLDNWIYFAEYAARFRWRGAGAFERSISSMRGQYGLSQDDFGRLYYNFNSGHLQGDMWPSHYRLRNPHHAKSGGRISPPVNQAVWPIRVTPGTNRAYIPENMEGHKIKNFTAACSPWIYRGDLFPADALGNAFACEPALHLVKRDILTLEQGKLVAREAYQQREFLASTDERFRPVSMTTGPDGALYVVDFYRGIIQHRISLSPYLEKYIQEHDLVDPRGLGRIWRIVPEKAKTRPAPNLTKLGSAELVPILAHSNSWHRETAQRLLVERADAAVVPALEALTRGEVALGRLHALWTLDGLGKSTWPVVEKALADADARVRNSAVRIAEGFFAGEGRAAAMTRLIALSATEPDSQVQTQIALTLGECQDSGRSGHGGDGQPRARSSLSGRSHPQRGQRPRAGTAGALPCHRKRQDADPKPGGLCGCRTRPGPCLTVPGTRGKGRCHASQNAARRLHRQCGGLHTPEGEARSQTCFSRHVPAPKRWRTC
jgi:glucose/arabinose dehydrogenase